MPGWSTTSSSRSQPAKGLTRPPSRPFSFRFLPALGPEGPVPVRVEYVYGFSISGAGEVAEGLQEISS